MRGIPWGYETEESKSKKMYRCVFCGYIRDESEKVWSHIEQWHRISYDLLIEEGFCAVERIYGEKLLEMEGLK